jgi:hypothetical protein
MKRKPELKAIDPKAAQPSKPKILVYGKPGVGKTWASLDFPNVYYIDTEGGADLSHYTDKLKASGGVYYGIKQGSLDLENIINQVEALATQQHDYKTIVIDSITEPYNLVIAEESEKLGSDDVFSASKKPAIKLIRRLIKWLKRVDMNVILIAHEKAEWKDQKQVGDTFDCWEKLEYQLHLCLNVVKLGSERLAKVRKSRLTGFPESSTIPWSYKDFAKAYGEDIIEKKVQQIILATDEQVTELQTLLDQVKLPDGWLDKCLKKECADEIEEMSTDSIQKVIDYIKSKFLLTN